MAASIIALTRTMPLAHRLFFLYGVCSTVRCRNGPFGRAHNHIGSPSQLSHAAAYCYLLDWFTFPFLLCFVRDMFLGIPGRTILHQPPIDLYTLARAFVQTHFSSYKLHCRLARHSQFHGRHPRPFNRFSPARVSRQLPFSFPTTVVTSYKC